jgi:hypothetical protein
MPKKVAHNCFQCSKLSHDEAQAKSCWDADRQGKRIKKYIVIPVE